MPAARVVLGFMLIVAVSACYVPRPTEPRQEVGGSYIVNGVDPDGLEYSGVLTVDPTATAGEYRLQWIITGHVQEGEGTLEGDTLTATWQSTSGFDAPARGTAEYVVAPDGTMTGTRTVAGGAGLGTEEVFPDL